MVGTYFLVSCKEYVNSYTLVINSWLYDFGIDKQEGGLKQPPSKNMFGKKRSGELGLRWY